MEDNEKKTRKRKKKERRSILRNRAQLVRVLRYAWPYKSAAARGLFFAFIAAFLGAASLLPMVPIIDHVLDPSRTEERQRRADKSATEDEAALRLLRRSGTTSQPDDGATQLKDHEEIFTGALEDLKGRWEWMTRLELRLSAFKDRSRERIFEFISNQQEDAIKWIALFLVLATALKAFLDYMAKYSMATVVYQSTQTLKVDLYSGCLDLDLATLQDRTSGNLISRLSSDISKVRTILQSALHQSIQVPFQILFLFILLMILSPKITLITIIALPLITIPITVLGKTLRRFARHDAEEDAYLVDVMQETIQGMQIVKAFGTERHERKRFRRVARGQVRRQIRRQRVALAAPAVTEVLTMAAMGLVLIAGAYVVLKLQEMTPGSFIVYLVALTRFYKPMKGLSSGMMKIQTGLASADRVFEIIDARPVVVEKPGAIELPPIRDSIVFDNVTFAYRKGLEPVLREFSLEVPRGARYALVGKSGAGKTTVTKLIPRFYDPNEGAIRIDGQDLRDVTFASLRRQIAMVTQETILFDASVFDNIAYGRRNATREQVEAAARAANAHEFIMALPQGYDTRIGERGGQLSGGQRQRIAIARALLRNVPILILDEATSALDNESEALVQEALERLMENRTVLVIAHRLSTVRDADQIVVMHESRVAEQGTHEVLMARGGRYAELCRKDLRDTDTYAEDDFPLTIPEEAVARAQAAE